MRKLVGGSYAPSVNLKNKPGDMFKGKYLGSRTLTTVHGVRTAYSFAIIDATAPIGDKTRIGTDQAGNAVMQWVEKTVKAGDKVEVFAPPTALATMLGQVVVGEIVEIVYKGRAAAKPGKQAAYIYEATVVDA